MTPEQEACLTAMNERAKGYQKWILGVTSHMGTRTAQSLGLEGEFGCVTGDGILETLFQIKPEGFSIVELPKARANNFAATCATKPQDVYSPEEFQTLFDEYVRNLQQAFIDELKEFQGGDTETTFVNWNAVNQP
jgi:hypothetical protein